MFMIYFLSSRSCFIDDNTYNRRTSEKYIRIFLLFNKFLSFQHKVLILAQSLKRHIAYFNCKSKKFLNNHQFNFKYNSVNIFNKLSELFFSRVAACSCSYAYVGCLQQESNIYLFRFSHLQLELIWVMRGIAPGSPEPHSCSKSKSVMLNSTFELFRLKKSVKKLC